MTENNQNGQLEENTSSLIGEIDMGSWTWSAHRTAYCIQNQQQGTKDLFYHLFQLAQKDINQEGDQQQKSPIGEGWGSA